MSQQQTVYLSRAKVPHLAALQEAIDALGFDCQVDDSYVPFESEGYLPCVLNGLESGCEILFEPASDPREEFPHLAAVIADRDVAISFRWSSSFAEGACIYIVSAALARSFDGIVHYEDDDMLYSVDEAIGAAHEMLAELKKQDRRH